MLKKSETTINPNWTSKFKVSVAQWVTTIFDIRDKRATNLKLILVLLSARNFIRQLWVLFSEENGQPGVNACWSNHHISSIIPALVVTCPLDGIVSNILLCLFSIKEKLLLNKISTNNILHQQSIEVYFTSHNDNVQQHSIDVGGIMLVEKAKQFRYSPLFSFIR